ncbi:MAG: T9SS type A sorting domain-containing protein [Draconibacterium sp.]
MRKFTLLFALLVVTLWSYGQILHGVSWVNWANEPDYEGVTGYAANPYENPEVTIYKAPSAWTPVADVASFDETWDLLGETHYVGNPTDVAGGDLFDLEGDGTFGAEWKGVHDGQNFYLLLKYFDTNGAADATSKTFEIMAQPTSYMRHEPTFVAGADSTADKTASGEDLVMNYQNQAYARSVELGGGKALFADGLVSEYAASVGVTKNAWQSFWIGNWGANEAGLEALLDANHFWDETDGVIRAVLVMSLDGALSYPTDPTNLAGDRTALKVGETFAFDVKSNAKVADANVQYFWSADKNNGYASNYYSGHVTLSPQTLGGGETSEFIMYGVSWVNWANEPDYEGITGYDANPYDNPEITIYKAPSTWTPVADVASFDATWDILGDAHLVSNPTDVAGGDLFDLESDGTFGAEWKGVHDGQNFYLFLKYLDINGAADATSKTFEIMAQPTSYMRHEPTFVAASDSTAENTASGENLVINYQNQAYARSVELGGGKALFSDGLVSEYAASLGVTKNAWQSFWIANWGTNETGLEALLEADHFWDETDGVIRAVLVMSLDGALSYPTDPSNLAGERTALKVGETFAFDVKSNAKVADANVQYFWSSDKNNGYGSNYYSGHLTLSDMTTGISNIAKVDIPAVYINNNVIHVRNSVQANLEVYNILGVKVKAANQVTRLSIQEFKNGIYLVKVNNGQQLVKVVKQ